MGDVHRLLRKPQEPDCEALKANLLGKGTPQRVHPMELLQDREIKEEICRVFDIGSDLDPNDRHYFWAREIALQRFLGYDLVRCHPNASPDGQLVAQQRQDLRPRLYAEDSTQIASQNKGVRGWVDEHAGPVQSWEDFERYPWPKPEDIRTDVLEWVAKHLPDGMGIYAGAHSIFENMMWLMGYENLALAIYDQPDLVDAIWERVGSYHLELCKIIVQMPRMTVCFAGDDMGYKTQTMISPKILIEKSLLPWHKKMAALAHERDMPYLLHSCGNLAEIMDVLIDEVKLDGKQSWEDTIMPLPEAKRVYGDRIALIGGIDMDVLTRGTEQQIRQRVREVCDACMPGGRFCLGAGNTIANYIPLESYLVMLDEGRNYL